MSPAGVALVVGPSGAIGRSLATALRRANWPVYGLSRNAGDVSRDGVIHCAADLLDPAACRAALADAAPITHVFYAARAPHGEGGVEDVTANVSMLVNAVDAVEVQSDALRHVHLVEGTKWYGVHLGPYRTPAREDDPRHMPPNFYYDQQDALAARQAGKPWVWSASRPNVVCDFAPGRARNLTPIIGAYAAICRELGAPFDFPGTRAGYESLTEITDGTYLADTLVWLTSQCRSADNQAFNITNGDAFRWSTMWPRLAAMCGLPCGEPRDIRLGPWMADKEPVWAAICARHGLPACPLADVAYWPFADFVFRQDWDVVSDLGRIRRAGFNACLDSAEMFATQLDLYRKAAILPPIH